MIMIDKKPIIKDFIKYMSPYRFLLIPCIFLQLGIAFLQIFQLHLLRTAIDVYVLKNNFLGLVKDVILVFLIVLCLFFLFTFLRVYLASYIGQNIMFDLRMKIFSHLQKMSLSFFDKNPIGKLMTVATNDVRHLRTLVSDGIASIFGNILLLVGITGYLFYQNYRLTMMICILIFIFGFFFLLINQRMRKVTRERRSWSGEINSFLQENITGIFLIKIFSQEKKQSDKLDYLNKRYGYVSRHALSYLHVPAPMATAFKATAMCSILWYGGAGVVKGTLSLGSLLVFIGSLSLFFVTIEEGVQINKTLQTARASLERIFGFLSTKPETEKPQMKVKFTEFKEKIEFKNVWFAYGDDNFVLENLNFDIQKGEQIGIVGHTGVGKSSITNLLARFYEINKGKILIDGVDIQNIQKSQLRSLIGIVPQEPFLFSGNIEDNIRLGNSKINSRQVQQAATYVGANKFISQLPNGYKENVQELGWRLSTGQKQLISFARANVFNPQIIVLDEVTANVDTETINKIENILKKIKGRKTSIIIAHHLSTVRDADKIVVLHMGRIQEIGTHRQLMEKKGIYYTLYLLQGVEDRLTTITRLVTKLTEIVGYARLHYVKNAQLARRIGEKLSLSEKQLEKLETAALIYDVGKIRIPFGILTKPALLTNKEFNIIKTHVTHSKKAAEKIENFEDIANIVYYHHERWDGKGYIEGLKGEEIPLESRIIAVVDAYQAMMSNRPYREALALEEAHKELLAGAGKQFDPHIVNIFLKVLDEKDTR